jgi:hypothetical protein
MTASQALLHPYLYESPFPKNPDQIACLTKFDIYQKILRKKLAVKKIKKK